MEPIFSLATGWILLWGVPRVARSSVFALARGVVSVAREIITGKKAEENWREERHSLGTVFRKAAVAGAALGAVQGTADIMNGQYMTALKEAFVMTIAYPIAIGGLLVLLVGVMWTFRCVASIGRDKGI